MTEQIANSDHAQRYSVVKLLLSMLKSVYLNYPKQLDQDEELHITIESWCLIFQDVEPRLIARIFTKLSSDDNLGEDAKFFPNPLMLKQRYCQPDYEDFGWPSVEQAYKEAVSAQGQRTEFIYSHPAILFTVAEITSWIIENLSEKVSSRRFATAYERLFEIYVREGEFPQYRALECQSVLEKADAIAERQLKEQMIKLGINPQGGRGEFKRLLESDFGAGEVRVKHGEKKRQAKASENVAPRAGELSVADWQLLTHEEQEQRKAEIMAQARALIGKMNV